MRLVDLFAREYGWSKSQVLELTQKEVEILSNLIVKHHKESMPKNIGSRR